MVLSKKGKGRAMQVWQLYLGVAKRLVPKSFFVSLTLQFGSIVWAGDQGESTLVGPLQWK